MECVRTWHWLGLSFCGDTLISTWIVSLIMLAWGLLAAAGAREHPSKWANAWEVIYEFIGRFVGENLTPGQRRFLTQYLMTLFVFILFGNFIGLVPGLHSPTNTLNTNLALATLTFLLVQGWALFAHGGGGLKRLVHGGPMGWIMLPITILEEFAKPITLSMRLYGNIFAGELIIVVLLQLLSLHTYMFLGFIPHVLWLAFGIFVGSIQAFIFMVLSLAYVGQATAHAEH